MQVKSEATDILSALQAKGAGSELKGKGKTLDASLLNGEFGELLAKADSELGQQDPNEALLNLIVGKNSGDEAEAGKLIKNESAKMMEGEDADLQTKFSMPGEKTFVANGLPIEFQSHEKLTSPELASQFKLEKMNQAGTVPTETELTGKTSLKDILGENTSTTLKEGGEKFEPGNIKEMKDGSSMKTLKNQPSADFLKQLQTASSDKVSVEKISPELNKKARINAYGKEQGVINSKLITLKAEGEDKSKEEKLEFGHMKNRNNLLNLMDKNDHNIMTDKVHAPRPVVDLSSVNAENKIELVNKISNYIEQNNIANSDNVDVLVRHEDLGTFQITANRNHAKGDMVDLKINTVSDQGKNFFVENEGELIKSLHQNGIKVSDLKISSNKDFLGMADMKGQGFERSFSDSSSQQGQSGQRGFNQNFSGREDSQRRRNLWQQFEQYQQASA